MLKVMFICTVLDKIYPFCVNSVHKIEIVLNPLMSGAHQKVIHT